MSRALGVFGCVVFLVAASDPQDQRSSTTTESPVPLLASAPTVAPTSPLDFTSPSDPAYSYNSKVNLFTRQRDLEYKYCEILVGDLEYKYCEILVGNNKAHLWKTTLLIYNMQIWRVVCFVSLRSGLVSADNCRVDDEPNGGSHVRQC